MVNQLLAFHPHSSIFQAAGLSSPSCGHLTQPQNPSYYSTNESHHHVKEVGIRYETYLDYVSFKYNNVIILTLYFLLFFFFF